jgi:uncharacterized protein (DUF58 family)
VPAARIPSTVDQTRLTAALRTVELTVRRRLDGLLQGNHLGLVPGPGSEPGDARRYEPGDDVRRMDWAVTARTAVPHIRQTVADRELETWLALDMSASMDFGTTSCEKRDLAVVAAAAIAHLTRGGGNRIGAVVAGGDGIRRIPARGGRPAVEHLLRTIAATPRAAPGHRGNLAEAVDDLRRPPRRHGLVVVVSDFLGAPGWERPIKALAARHDVMAVEITDPRDLELPAVGQVTLVDPESGRTKRVQATRALTERFAVVAADHRHAVAAGLRRAGAAHLWLSTDRDWVTDLLRFVMRIKRGWGGTDGSARARRDIRPTSAAPGR